MSQLQQWGGTVVGSHWPPAQIMTLTPVNSLVPQKWSVITVARAAVAGVAPADRRATPLLSCRLRLKWDISPILRVHLVAIGDHPLPLCVAQKGCTQMYSSHSKSMSGLVSTIVMMKNGLENSPREESGPLLADRFKAALLDWKKLNWNCVWDLIWMPLNLKFLACGKYGIIYAILIPWPTQVVHYSLTTCNRNQV